MSKQNKKTGESDIKKLLDESPYHPGEVLFDWIKDYQDKRVHTFFKGKESTISSRFYMFIFFYEYFREYLVLDSPDIPRIFSRENILIERSMSNLAYTEEQIDKIVDWSKRNSSVSGPILLAKRILEFVCPEAFSDPESFLRNLACHRRDPGKNPHPIPPAIKLSSYNLMELMWNFDTEIWDLFRRGTESNLHIDSLNHLLFDYKKTLQELEESEVLSADETEKSDLAEMIKAKFINSLEELVESNLGPESLFVVVKMDIRSSDKQLQNTIVRVREGLLSKFLHCDDQLDELYHDRKYPIHNRGKSVEPHSYLMELGMYRAHKYLQNKTVPESCANSKAFTVNEMGKWAESLFGIKEVKQWNDSDRKSKGKMPLIDTVEERVKALFPRIRFSLEGFLDSWLID
jgi:hypothetical protein